MLYLIVNKIEIQISLDTKLTSDKLHKILRVITYTLTHVHTLSTKRLNPQI